MFRVHRVLVMAFGVALGLSAVSAGAPAPREDLKDGLKALFDTGWPRTLKAREAAPAIRPAPSGRARRLARSLRLRAGPDQAASLCRRRSVDQRGARRRQEEPQRLEDQGLALGPHERVHRQAWRRWST